MLFRDHVRAVYLRREHAREPRRRRSVRIPSSPARGARRSRSSSLRARRRVSASPRARWRRIKILSLDRRARPTRARPRERRARVIRKSALSRASPRPASSRVASRRRRRRRRRRRAPFDRIACIISHRPPRSISARWRLRTRRTPLASVSELARRCDEVVGPNAYPTSRTVARRRRRRRSRATIGARALARVPETAARPSARRRRPRRRRRARRARRRARGARRRRRVRRTLEAATRARGGASSVAVRKRNARRRGVVVERRMIDGAGSRVPLGWRRSPRARRDGQPPRAFPRRAPARTT
jgi:hypothetical protein